MKVLIVNDCISKKTGAFALLKSIFYGIAEQHEIEWVNVHDLNMQPCRKCLKCRPCGECILPEDDAHRIGRKMFAADALVIGLNSTLQNVSLPFETLLDRCKSAIAFQDRQGKICPWRKGRSVAVASLEITENMPQTPTGRNDIGHPPLLRTLKEGGFKLVGNIAERRPKNSIPEELPMLQARSLGHRLF